MSVLHGRDHIGAGGLIANPPAAGDIHADAIAADKIGIKADDLIVLYEPWSAFLKPRVGAGTRGQKACFNPLAAAPNIFCMQHGPNVIFAHLPAGHPSTRGLFHCAHGGLAGMAGAAHRFDLIWPFDHPGLLCQLFALKHFKPFGLQRSEPDHHDFINRQAHIAAAMAADQIIDFTGKGFCCQMGHIPAVKIEEICSGTLFAHQRIELRKKGRIFVVPHDHIAIGADDQCTKWVMGVPELHICAVTGITDIERVKNHQGPIVAGRDPLHQPVVPKTAHLLQIRQLKPGARPFVKRQFGWTNLYAIHIIGGVVAGHCAAAGVNLAVLAEWFDH